MTSPHSIGNGRLYGSTEENLPLADKEKPETDCTENDAPIALIPMSHSVPDEMQRNTLKRGHNGINPDIDGGWGWMVVLGCAVMHLFLGGWTRSYGVVYVELRETFNSSAALTAWVGGAGTALRMGASPVATALAKRFSVKAVTFAGGVILALGVMLIGFGSSIEYMFFPISFLAGLGGCLMYSPAIVHVGEYFDKKRGVATGISTAGSGLGVFLFPPLLELLFYEYGLLGACLIMGAMMLNCCVSALLYRPLKKQHIVPTVLVENIKNGDLTTSETKQSDSAVPRTKEGEVTGLRKYLNYKLLLDIRFLSFAISLGLVTSSYISSQILIPDHAIHCGVNATKATLLLSIIGAADIVGRLGSGFIFDISCIRPIRRHIYYWAIAATSCTIYGWGFSCSFEALVVLCVLHGTFNGCVVSQRATIVADIVGIEQLSSSFGLTVFCQGFGALFGPLVAGLLRDKTGSYKASYIFTGTASTAAFVILYLGFFYERYTKHQSQEIKKENTIHA